MVTPLAPPAGDGPLPAGIAVVLDHHVRRLAGGRVLIGGSPTRLLRLTAAGATLLDTWIAGAPPRGEAARALARRLVDAGIAHPRPAPAPLRTDDVTVVVPVRDREAQLDRCLAALGAGGGTVVVVDDGSRDATAIARVARRHDARLVRREASRGAAAARNAGLAHCTTPFVAFVDSDCLASPGWLAELLPHMADPRVAAVAPRIVAAPTARDTWIARFEAERSPLDMGPREGPVAPLSRLPYVPTAALLARRSATGAGFDAAMPIGEDIDLVWRLIRSGWTVRYDPSVTVAHDHRVTFVPWLQRRFVYGTSAAALAVRHPGAIPAAVLTPFGVAFWSLVAMRRPGSALASGALAAWLLSRRLGAARLSPAESLRLSTVGLGWSGWSLAVALTRTWLPVTAVLALRSRRARRLLLLGSVLPRAVELRATAPRLALLPALAASVADDVAYAAGVWTGCLRNRTLGPLRAQIVSRRSSG